MEIEAFNKKKQTARKFYEKLKPLYSPYLDGEVVFNSKGFHHLRYSAGSERPKGVQVLTFALLPLAVKIIKKSATLQEYKKELQTFGRPDKAGMKKNKGSGVSCLYRDSHYQKSEGACNPSTDWHGQLHILECYA